MSSNNNPSNNLCVKLVEQTRPDGSKVMACAPESLIKLWRMSHKIAPTDKESVKFNYFAGHGAPNLASKEELDKAGARTILELIYRDPDFWTVDRIRKESWRFEGVRGLGGKTYLRDAKGEKISKALLLVILDIDSPEALDRCKDLLKEDWIKNTFVIKTHDRDGYRVSWLEEWNDGLDYVGIDGFDCLSDKTMFEIMLGLKYQQMAGPHRDYLDEPFRYEDNYIGCQDLKEPALALRPRLYHTLVTGIFADLLDGDRIKARRKAQLGSHDPFFRGVYINETDGTIYENGDYIELELGQIEPITNWALKFYGLNNHYNLFMLSFLGTLAWYRYSYSSTCKVIDLICDKSGEIGSNTKSKWYDTARRGYEKLAEGLPVAGVPKLKLQLQRSWNNSDEEKAEKEVNNLIYLLTKGGQYDPKIKRKKVEIVPDNVISVSEAVRQTSGLYRVEGNLLTTWPGVDIRTDVTYRCLDCSVQNGGQILRYDDESDRPSIFVTPKEPKECVNCGKSDFAEISDQTIVKRIVICELQDSETYSDINTLRIVLFDDHTGDIDNHIGEKIEVVGRMHILQDPSGSKWKYQPYLYINEIKYETVTKQVIASESEIDEIEAYVAKHGENTLNKLIEEHFATHIIGHHEAKKGLLLTAESTNLDVTKPKVDTALMGDVGTGKTELIEFVTFIVTNGSFQTAQGTSGKSLIVVVESENKIFVARPGPVILARGGICALDEGGQMKYEDQGQLLNVLAKQFVTYAKHGRHGKLRAPTALAWSSNPIGGKFKDPNQIDMDDFPVLKPLIDRFDLIFTCVDTRDPNIDEQFADSELGNSNNKAEVLKKRDASIAFLKTFVAYTKTLPEPDLSEPCKVMLKQTYQKIRHLEFGSMRMLPTLILLTKMIARLKLKSIADSNDALEAQELYQKVLEPLGKMLHVTTNPDDEIVEVCVEKLFESKFAWKFLELLREISKDERVSRYKYLPDALKSRNSRVFNEIFERLTSRDGISGFERSGSRIVVWQPNEKGNNVQEESDTGAAFATAKNDDANNFQDLEKNNFSEKTAVANVASAASYIKGSGNSETSSNTEVQTTTKQVMVVREETKTLTEPPFEDTIPELLNSAAFDCEWYYQDPDGNTGIYCACFYPANGEPIKLHIEDEQFGKDKSKFINEIVKTLEKYDLLIGHNILGENSDLAQIGNMYYAFGAADLSNEQKFDKLSKIIVRCIDTLKVFKLTIIKSMLSQVGINYPSNKLGDISKACIGETKLDDLTGLEAQALPPDKQLEYCLRDAELAMKNLRRGNWVILQTFWGVKDVVNMSLLDLCNAEYPIRIGESIFKFNKYSTDVVPSKYKDRKIDYKGGEVIKPTPGVYRDVITLDFKAMYPTIISKYNLSSETLNCVCCKGLTRALLPIEVTNEVDAGLKAKKEEPLGECWVCQNQKGKFAEIEQNLSNLKDYHAGRGEIVKSKGMKLVANSLYGLFQNMSFKYRDQRLGFIITGFGRTMIKTLKQESEMYALSAIYGDTDSIFLQSDQGKEETKRNIDAFIKSIDTKYKASLAIDKEWDTLLLTQKKSYYGITKQGAFIHKIMYGMRSSNTELQKELMHKIVNKELLELYVKDSERAQSIVLEEIRCLFKELTDNISDETYIKERLAYSFKSSKPLDEYENNGYPHEVYLERSAEGKDISADNRYHYYKIKPIKINDGAKTRDKNFTTYPTKYELDIDTYRRELFNCVVKIIAAFGINVKDLRKELNIKAQK